MLWNSIPKKKYAETNGLFLFMIENIIKLAYQIQTQYIYINSLLCSKIKTQLNNF